MEAAKLSINEFTTLPRSFTEDVKAYAAAGARGIGICEAKLPIGRDADMHRLLEEARLLPSLCIGTVPSPLPDALFPNPVDPRDRVIAMRASIERLAAFQPDCIIVLSGAPDPGQVDGGWSIAVSALREVAQFARNLGVEIALEPIRKTSGTLTPSLDEAARMLDEADAQDMGLIFDFWHLWDAPDVIDAITRHATRLAGVQVSDRREPTRSWADRVLPGDGIIDFSPVLRTLQAVGYGGWFDLEVFSDDGRFGDNYPDSLWTREAGLVARDGMASLRSLWST